MRWVGVTVLVDYPWASSLKSLRKRLALEICRFGAEIIYLGGGALERTQGAREEWRRELPRPNIAQGGKSAPPRPAPPPPLTTACGLPSHHSPTAVSNLLCLFCADPRRRAVGLHPCGCAPPFRCWVLDLQWSRGYVNSVDIVGKQKVCVLGAVLVQ